MQEQPRRAVPSPICSGNDALTLSLSTNGTETSGNGDASVQRTSSVRSVSSPKSPMSPVQEEIQRVRKQIEDMAHQLKDAFANEKYEEVKTIGEKKKELEDKLKSFEEQYSNDKHELQEVKSKIAQVDDEMKAAFESENYKQVAELGKRKQDLKTKLADLESNFGLHNAVYQVGDRVSVVGLTSPRGGSYNGVVGTITEYMERDERYKVKIQDGTDIAIHTKNLKASDEEAQSGQSKTRSLQGEIKLWFPRKHFGFITPDNKPEGEPDIFFHGTHVENRKDFPVKRFARVQFSVIPAPKGPQARDVSITGYQPEKEAEAAVAAGGVAPTGGRSMPHSPGRPNQPRRPNNGMQSPGRFNVPSSGMKQVSLGNMRKTASWGSNTGRSPRENAWHNRGERKDDTPPPMSIPADDAVPAPPRPPENALGVPRWCPQGQGGMGHGAARTPSPDEGAKPRRRGKRQRGSRGGKKKRKQKEAKQRRALGPSSENSAPPASAPMNITMTLVPANTYTHSPPPKSPGRGDDPNWRRPRTPQRGQDQGGRARPDKIQTSAPTSKSKRPPPGFGGAPPGLSPISAPNGGDSLPGITHSMPMSGGMPPITTSMQSIDSDDESYVTNRVSHPAAQKRSPQRPYGSSGYDGPGRNPQAPASAREPQLGGMFNPHAQNLTRLPSCTTDELPSFELDQLGRWESIVSTDSIHFSDNPSPLGPVSARGQASDNGAWGRQDSPRERLIRRAEKQKLNNTYRSRAGQS